MIRKLAHISLALAVYVAATSTISVAEEKVFEFVSLDGDRIASLTVDISGKPAEMRDIGPLTFTDKGNELFGFGAVYFGTFDTILRENFPLFTIDDNGGLGGLNADNVREISFGDVDPPASSVWGAFNGHPILGFSISAAENANSDNLFLAFADPTSGTFTSHFSVIGDFLLVPEPGMSLWCVLALTAAGTRARRRRSRTNRRWADKSVVDAHSPPIRLMNAAGLLECVE